MPDLSPQEIRALRLRAQWLEPRASGAELLETVVRSTGGMQAQQTSALLLALRARSAGLTPRDVQAALAERRSLAVTWAMRGTLHLLPAEDVGWIVALLGPVFAARDRRRRLELGLGDELCARSLPEIRAILAESGPLARGELAARLAAHGITLEPGQALIHLIQYAALAGLLCQGPQRANGEPTYVLLEDWLGRRPALDRVEALARLARRYLHAFAPASLRDFAAWSGLGAADARRGWQLALPLHTRYITTPDGAPGERLWWPQTTVTHAGEPVSGDPVVRLLPAFDTYLLGYADRDLVVPPAYRGEVYHGGQVVPVVLVDGLAAGVWRYERRGKRLAVSVRPFAAFDASVRQGITGEAEDIGRFLGLPVTLV
jgi:hypothetical protein